MGIRTNWSGTSRVASLTLLLLAQVAAAEQLSDSRTIGIYFDAAGTVCQGNIRPGTPGFLYVLAKLGENTDGIAGAEFRFAGAPDSWETYPVANENGLAIGNPFGNGVIIAFPCQRPEDSVVLLYTVVVLAMDDEEDLRFSIEARNPSSNPTSPCPLVVNCDVPAYSLSCVRGGSCTINSTRPGTCDIVAVETTSWSSVKQLYQ